ncbi:hypothetical protein QCA50_017988 [Cerrena zonata]|uniref:DNA polymerase epsilon subunit D n=1 Tax=Cerrena zonata TaxID=2478898 RepID=A0AAW0FLI8_9APHY
MPRKESTTAPTAQAQQDANSEGIDAYDLPRSLVTRIARSALPDNVKLQKETVLALLKGSTVFVNYIAATAHDVAASKQHKSISASDVLKALEATQFGDMVDKLQDELQVYRELQKTSRAGKGSSTASAKGKGKDTTDAATDPASSISNGKGKGKEKATSGPTITIPASVSRATATTETSQAASQDGEVGVTMIAGDEELEDEQVYDEGEDEVMEDEDEDEAEDEDEVDDAMALEEEEERRDARGLDETRDKGQAMDVEE